MIGGAAEFVGLEAAPNFACSKALVALAKRYFPGAQSAGWHGMDGHRPTTPDTCRSSGRLRSGRTSSMRSDTGTPASPSAPPRAASSRNWWPGVRPSLDLAPFTVARFGWSLCRRHAATCTRILSSVRRCAHLRQSQCAWCAGGGARGSPTWPMAQKRQIFVAEHDWVRQALMFEPRGHDAMSGADPLSGAPRGL